LKKYISLLHDLFVAGSAFLLSYITVIGVERTLATPGIWEKTGAFVGLCCFFFIFFSVHHGSWRYVSIPSLATIIKATVFSVLIYTVGAFLLTRGSNVPRSVPVLSTLYMIAGLSGSRLAYRLFLEHSLALPVPSQQRSRKKRNVLLYGLTDAAESFIRSTRRDVNGETVVVGILDDGESQARIVQGVKVLGSLSDLAPIVAKFQRGGTKIAELIVTGTLANREQLGEIVEMATRLGIKASRIPSVTETSLISSSGWLEPKPIELGDLLGRPEVKADLEGVAGLINSKVVLATGAGGSIGSELCRQISMFGPNELVITDSSEFHLYLLDMELRERHPNLKIVTRIVDVRDKNRVSRLFEATRPEVVFHAAALKHVPLVENNPLEGIKTNLLGTRNVADAAMENGAATFVMISTDKAVNPTNIMGATKRAAEAYCQALDVVSEKTRFKTVRFGNVLGSNGSVVPRFQEQIANGGPVTVTHPNMVRFFMTIPEAVRLVLHASAHALRHHSDRGKIMVLDMGEPVRIADLAERMIQLAGFRPHTDIEIVFTGLRPGEKLYEELFDPSEAQDGLTDEGYVIASPRVIDKGLLHRTLSGIETAAGNENPVRALELLSHIVPEYRATHPDEVAAGRDDSGADQG
jgi:FlaA1/EpsC-like NDP-sugar epimerase